ncbi:uncharacterized protein [Leptinotarsa decemlineata]|uniref:uncharacterized protein n=1 Tax=Leptinotarsa decemlineata TaxID=7539 RepID=UPI003D308158
MDSNKMTSEPNHQNPPSIFGFDPYPPPYPVNWNNSNPFSNTEFRIPDIQPQTYPNVSITPAISNVPAQVPQMNFMMNASIPSQVQTVGMVPSMQPGSSFSFGGPRPVQDVVQFPFQITNNAFGQREFRCKRKTDSPPLQPTKQHITEEKMVEHMSNLHINSESSSSKESESSRTKRLYMCQEMRKFKTDPILPQCLLNRIQQPCTALVLWKPPMRLIPTEDVTSDDENLNNNTESVNLMAADGEIDVDKEVSENVMDLDNC